MSETKFTPGPWRVGANSNGIATIVLGPDDIRRVAIAAFHGNEPGSREEGEANARLIASTPDGYAANKEAADFIRAYFGPVASEDAIGWSDNDARRVYAVLRAAIAKAEGRS